MSLDAAVRDGTRSLGSRPTSVLPFYVAGLAVPVIARVVPFLGIVLAYLALQGTGRIDAIRDVLEPAAPIEIDDPGTIDVNESALEDALRDLLTPSVIAIIAVTALVAIVIFAVVQAAASAGKFHAVYAVLTGEDATIAGVHGVFANTWTFLGLLIAELLAYLLLFGAATALIVLAVVFDVPWIVFFALPAFLLAILLSMGVRLVFAFARPSAVVDDAGVRSAVGSAYGYVRRNPFGALGYGTLAIGLVVIAGTIGNAFGLLGAPSVSTLLPLILVSPVLDLTKTSLYAQHRDVDVSAPPAPDAGRRARFRGAVGRGWNELIGFTRDHLGLLAISTGIFVAGIAIGLVVGTEVDELFTSSIEARLGAMGPIGAFFHYAANNWSVAAGQSLAGIAFGIPTIASLAFNGVNIGVLYQLEVEPEILVAFVVPHGLLEIPALLVSGALGLHLGRVGWGYAFGAADRERIAAAIDRAFQVLIGLAVLFVLAAVIEAAVSPYYWRLLGI